jgi:SAM-dependent methyltransferase
MAVRRRARPDDPVDTRWPKVPAPLTARQREIYEDFVRYWHEVLPRRYSRIEQFNHRYPRRAWPSVSGRLDTLEIGAGLGEHLEYEDLERQHYTCIELRPEMSARIEQRFPNVRVVTADCQERLPFDDDSFDRIIAVHVLEHLPNLPAALDELRRLLRPEGRLGIVIPCDPGVAYEIARRVSAQRIFERRYGEPYRPFIRREHLNSPAEVVGLLQDRFTMLERRYYPLRLPATSVNLCLGIVAVPAPSPAGGQAS